MKIEADTVKGFQDFMPLESLKRNKIREIVEKNFQLYAFLPLETPIVEFDELMRSDELAGEDEAISDRFRLRDKAGRNLGLRYEFTFQLARILKQNPNLKMPFKRYQIGPVFRDEPVKTGRLRQFTQCDIDIIGDSSLEADAECIAAFSSILKELKVKSDFVVNNRKLLDSIIKSVQISKPRQVMRELDKIDKLGEDEVKTNLRNYADTNQILTLFKLLEKDLSFFEENAFEGAEELRELVDLCKNYGIKLTYSPFMVRGFSYYTGNVFEARLEGKKDSIAGGGRYDKTVGKYLGREIPAVGFSFGLERLSSLVDIKLDQIPRVVLISIDQDKEALSLATKLRKSNVSCSLMFGKPGKALEYANSYQIPYTVFIGEKEIENKKFKLKDMDSGDEKDLTEKQLISKLSK